MKSELKDNMALYDFWSRNRHILPNNQQSKITAVDWNAQVCSLSSAGRGTEEALHFVLNHRPSFEDFVEWVQMACISPMVEPTLMDKVLTDEDQNFWNENGFLVVKNAVSQEQCAAARSAIWKFLDASAEEPESWYKEHPDRKGLMVAFFQHEALAAIRSSAKIRKIYEELYGTDKLYLLVDKVSFNPPISNSYQFRGSTLHWDTSLVLPIPYILQGLLYLNDVKADDGAFNCVPGFHRKIDEWINSLPEGTHPRDEALKQLQPVAVPGSAGDLVIWHQALPHCATANTGTTPRMVQYIAYKPIHVPETEEWK